MSYCLATLLQVLDYSMMEVPAIPLAILYMLPYRPEHNWHGGQATEVVENKDSTKTLPTCY